MLSRKAKAKMTSLSISSNLCALIISILLHLHVTGIWMAVPATNCSSACGQSEGTPQPVLCSTGNVSGCDEGTKPDADRCPSTNPCGSQLSFTHSCTTNTHTSARKRIFALNNDISQYTLRPCPCRRKTNLSLHSVLRNVDSGPSHKLFLCLWSKRGPASACALLYRGWEWLR